MTFNLLLGGLGYVLFMISLAYIFFPKSTKHQVFPQMAPLPVCGHLRRKRYWPEFSVGDESDYNSQCLACGTLLRCHPNA